MARMRVEEALSTPAGSDAWGEKSSFGRSRHK
jgi:hypothetical protein